VSSDLLPKQGSSLLRWALVQAAHIAGRSTRFAGYYERLKERHGTAKAAVALARKLATISDYRWRAAEVRHLPHPAVMSSGVHLG